MMSVSRPDDGDLPSPRSAARAGGPAARIVAAFSRVTTSGGFIPEIDGLRFIAISTVFLYHLLMALAIKAPDAYGPPASGGAIAAIAGQGFHGVELFFILSGFILALPFASHHLRGTRPVPLKQYFLRRITRLEPPYVISLLLVFGLLVVFKGKDAGMLAPHLAASLFYVHNLTFGTMSLINNVAWSLEIEIQFYVLVPLLTMVFALRSKAARRGVLAFVIVGWTIGAWFFLNIEAARSYWSILRFLQFFLVGFLLADIYLCDWRAHASRSWRWDIAALFGWTSMFLLWSFAGDWPFLRARFAEGEPLLAAVLFPPLALLCYMAAFRGRISNAIVTNVWIATVGGMCYSIYLLHNPLIGAVTSLTHRFAPTGSFSVNFIVQLLIAAPAVLVPCAAYFLLIEKPCMQRDWPARLIGRLAPRSRRRLRPPSPQRLID